MHQKKRPFLTKEKIEEIAETFDTPFHIYDEKAIRENARELHKAFSWNPGSKSILQSRPHRILLL